LVGCKKDKDENNQVNNSQKDVRTFDAKLVEIISPMEDFDGDAWNDFMYICRYQITNSPNEDIESGTIYNVIISKTTVTKPSFKCTVINSDVKFEINSLHRLTISTSLPQGWEGIKEDFSDDRIGLLACLKVETVNSIPFLNENVLPVSRNG
jgi:hypothetical protein